jgi:hypothetical protein
MTEDWIPACAVMTEDWIPAFAGMTEDWIPAFAGMTRKSPHRAVADGGVAVNA